MGREYSYLLIDLPKIINNSIPQYSNVEMKKVLMFLFDDVFVAVSDFCFMYFDPQFAKWAGR